MRVKRFFLAVLIMPLLMQAACTSGGHQRPDSEQLSEKSTTLAMASQTWQRTSGSALPAVEDLVQQADALIAMRNLDVASEKLERALRISPGYAPAWSRMAHIALTEANPARAIQMAKRSNSHAGNVVELKLLNWQYIRRASQMLGDTDGALNAEKSIKILNSL